MIAALVGVVIVLAVACLVLGVAYAILAARVRALGGAAAPHAGTVGRM